MSTGGNLNEAQQGWIVPSIRKVPLSVSLAYIINTWN